MKSLVVVYRFQDYKFYLLKVEEEFSRHQRGFRSRLAENLGVQNAYISKVLNQDKVHFTLEQAMAVARSLELEADARAYLIWMVEAARAGSEELKAFFLERIEQAQAKHLNLQNRVGQAKTLSEEDQNRFYSHWLFVAVHVLTSIPKYTTIEAIAGALRADENAVRDVLMFLAQAGLVETQGDRFVIGPAQLHLPKDSPNILKHHTNWRLRAIDDAATPGGNGVHYSTVSSLSQTDFEKLRHELTQVIQNYVAVVRESPEETACCFTLDFFRLVP